MRQKRGFTLVEVLVVMAIIAVLLSLLMPALSRSRLQAKFVVCANNEQQIVHAALAYAMDNQGRFPRFDGPTGSDNPHDTMSIWHTEMMQYGLLKSSFFCPFTSDAVSADVWGAGGWSFGGYGWWAPRSDPQYNKIFPPDPKNTSWPVNGTITARGPTGTGDPVGMISPLVTDDLYLYPSAVPNAATFNVAQAPPADFYQVDCGHVFNGKVADVNEAYGDGHVERVPATNIKCCYESGNAWVCR